MSIGLSTYAFFWQGRTQGPTAAERPLDLPAMIDKTADWGVDRFQICDDPSIQGYDQGQLAALRGQAERRGITLELGTRGVHPDDLARYLRIAERLDVTLVRSMITSGDQRPSPADAVAWLRDALPAYEKAGVTLALETYEQVPTPTVVEIVATVGSRHLGVCLDPANSVAALEHPSDTIARTADLVVNLHVKDFTFSRQDGWVGFTLAGCPLGTGLLPYAELLRVVRPSERGISMIIEHWLPWQGDSATTIATEDAWTLHSLNHLRSTT
ncbi:MAG: sugar phosphate isomerase/epimerase family protein [Propionibacteriaceae bacterium]